jgi:protein-S-isoprenylcysteine O-methyltransferase Ste14
MFITLIIGWVLYFVIHSFLASNYIKNIFQIRLPSLFRYYRIFFNLVAIIGLIIMVRLTFNDNILLFKQTTFLFIISIVLIILGLVVLVIASKTFNLKEFLGIETYEIKMESKLVTKGIYKFMRHPLYTGTILLLSGYFLYVPTLSVLIFLILTFVYIEIGSRLEEKKLLIEFGNDYTEYCKNVKRYFPFIY